MLSSLDPVELMSILNEFQAMNISGLAVLPMDDVQVKSKINQIAKNKTAVVTFNSRLEGIDEICFIGQDHYKGGRIAAGLMEKIIPEEGDIGVIISTKNLSCHQDRLLGFTSRIAESKLPFHYRYSGKPGSERRCLPYHTGILQQISWSERYLCGWRRNCRCCQRSVAVL